MRLWLGQDYLVGVARISYSSSLSSCLEVHFVSYLCLFPPVFSLISTQKSHCAHDGRLKTGEPAFRRREICCG